MDLTRYMDLSLKPIPKQSPIPPNSVACLLGSYNSDDLEAGTLFVICKNKHEVVIRGPPLKMLPGMENMEFIDLEKLLDNQFMEYITVIEDLVPTIEFGITRWAQLVPDAYAGGFQIIPDYDKQLRRVSCPIWAPIIPLEEIEFTVWGLMTDRRGIWKGREVDVFYACDDWNMLRLNRAMYAIRHVDGLDFTFELYGHLADSDGRIVGLVSEAARGRMVTPSDKEFVASELKRLESFGCIYRGVWCNHLLISDGKLRLLQWILICHYPDPEKRRREAALRHAQDLDNLCEEMEDFGPIGHYRFIPNFLTDETGIINYVRHSIPRTISIPTMVFAMNYDRPGFRAVIKFGDGSRNDEDDHPTHITSLRIRRPQQELLRLPHSNSGRSTRLLEDTDAPLSSFRIRHRIFTQIRHPYGRSTSGRILKALHDSSSPESTIDTVSGSPSTPSETLMSGYDQ